MLKLDIYKTGREFRWRLRAKNHRIIAASSEGYRRRRDLFANVRAVLLCAIPKQDQNANQFKLAVVMTPAGHFIRLAQAVRS